jgi:predicted HicB family RNase H-like nuclease
MRQRRWQGGVKGIQKVVAEVVTDMSTNGKAAPAALAEKNYSVEFCVRIPPLVHRNLALMTAG